jgi:HEAT repeat protein
LALADPYPQVKKEAIGSLGRLAAVALVPELLAFLKSDVADLRCAAAYALGEIRAPRAVPSLRELTGDPDVQVRKAAIAALDAIRSE